MYCQTQTGFYKNTLNKGAKRASHLCIWFVVAMSCVTHTVYAQVINELQKLNQMNVYSSQNNSIQFGFKQNNGFIDEQQESQIAKRLLRQVNKSQNTIEDAWIQDTFNDLIGNINAQARTRALVASVIYDNSQINAFATPGGLVVVNSGLILNAETVDELVGVLAHEVAHISQKHFSRSNETLAQDFLVKFGGLLAGALVAKENTDLGTAIIYGSNALTKQSRLTYSRAFEKEADSIGMQIMHSAGFNANAMNDFFVKLLNNHDLKGKVPEFLLTHPLTQNRISEAKQRLSNYPFKATKRHKISSQLFNYMKWRLMVLKTDVEISEVKQVAYGQSNDAPPAQLALAKMYLILGGKTNIQNAQKLLNAFPKNSVANNLVMLTQAEIYILKNEFSKAKTHLKQALSLYPESRALKLAMANVFRIVNQPNDAMQILKPLIKTHPYDLVLWNALDTTANALPKNTINEVQALRYHAEALFWKNDKESALKSLQRAELLAKNLPSLSAKIKKRKQRILMLIRKEK